MGELVSALGAAFLGGLILNIMPCVLPVLTMKVFHVVEHAGDDRKTFRMHGLAYTAGILAAFLLLGLGVVALRASGELVGWGMQFQNPAFVAAMTGLMVVFGLNSLEVFEFTVSLRGDVGGHGYLSSFLNGVVACAMSTPCSAPFLGTAATFALAAGTPWWETLLLFAGIGLGLAAPFLLVSFVPALAKVLPRPGPWMIHFKKLMGFTLLGAAVWLYGVLLKQVGPDAGQKFLGFTLVLAASLWAVGTFGGIMESSRRRAVVRALALAATVLGGAWLLDLRPSAPAMAEVAPGQEVVKDGKIAWAPFDSARVAAELKRGRPVFIDYTADWCANCKANEKAFIEVSRIREVFQGTNILPMKADLTRDNEEIWQWISKLDRSAIPVYAIYMPDGQIDLLPVAITTEMLAERLETASRRFPPTGFGPLADAR